MKNVSASVPSQSNTIASHCGGSSDILCNVATRSSSSLASVSVAARFVGALTRCYRAPEHTESPPKSPVSPGRVLHSSQKSSWTSCLRMAGFSGTGETTVCSGRIGRGNARGRLQASPIAENSACGNNLATIKPLEGGAAVLAELARAIEHDLSTPDGPRAGYRAGLHSSDDSRSLGLAGQSSERLI